MTAAQVAKQFGCTEAQARAQFRANAQQLAGMAAQARAVGKKVRGYTAEQLEDRASKMMASATA